MARNTAVDLEPLFAKIVELEEILTIHPPSPPIGIHLHTAFHAFVAKSKFWFGEQANGKDPSVQKEAVRLSQTAAGLTAIWREHWTVPKT